MNQLGTLAKINDLRSIWNHEERDFSAWLAREENLALLSKEIGIDLLLEEREASVGDFSADILAKEDGTDRLIIIENQLSDTDHDHLGKIITYASGKNAEVVIWIVKRARDEHRRAIDWLNENTDENLGFFLIEIELWQIEGSLPAPKFNVVIRPNDWAKTIKSSKNISEIKQLQFEFWQQFKEYAGQTEVIRYYTLRKARPQHWYDLGLGISEAHISLTINSVNKKMSAAIYIPDDKDLFTAFEGKKQAIESELGFQMEWRYLEGKKASTIIIEKKADINDQEKWSEYFDWLIEKVIKMKIAFNKYR